MNDPQSCIPGLELAESTDTENKLTFHPFPYLPAELRQKIWQLASPKPCCVFSTKYETKRYENPEAAATFRAIIQTCHEARSQFIYTKSKPPTQLKKSHAMYRACRFPPSFSNVFFSFEFDSLNFMFFRCSTPSHRKISSCADNHIDLDILKPNSELPEQSQNLEDYKSVKHISAGLDEFINPRGASSSSDQEEPYIGFNSLPKFFPSLETITLLINDPPQQGGISPGSITDMWISVEMDRTQKRVLEASKQFEHAKKTIPDWIPPHLKFRGHEEFMASPLN